MIVVYKIKNSEGLFSTGGYNPNWTKRGKSWGSMSALKSHLRQFCHDYKTDSNPYRFYRGWWNEIPKDWIVVELSEQGLREYSAKELYPKTTGENK